MKTTWSKRLLELNPRQGRVVVSAAILCVAMGLYPPWYHVYVNEVGTFRSVPGAYSYLLAPPVPLARENWYATHISFDILAIQWLGVAVAAALAVRGLKTKNDAESRPFDRYPMNH